MALMNSLEKQYRKIKTIYSKTSALQLFAVFFVITLAFYLCLVFFLGTTNFFATVVSGSMQPALYRGDLVVLIKNGQFEKGDIIVFKKGQDTIIHRIVGETSQGFKTKGDHNNFVDFGTVKKDDILGKSFLVLPKLGFINLFLAGK